MSKDDLIDVIKDAGYGVLGTVDADAPKVRPMMPYLTESGDLLLAVLPTCRTIGQIQANPKVEICYIDRKMRFARISGTARLLEDAQEKKALVWDNIPMLRQYFTGPEDPNFRLIEITTSSAELMTPQQRSPELISLK